MPILKCDATIATHQFTNFLLNSLEAHEPTRLAFEMIDYASKALKVHAASVAGAVIEILLVWYTASTTKPHKWALFDLRVGEFRCWLRLDS